MRNILLILAVVQGMNSGLSAQDVLTLEESIQTTLDNNYGIKIARKDIEIAANNATKTAVGYNPTVSANGGASFDLGGSTQTLGSGQENSTQNAFSYRANASLGATYRLFDQTRAVSLEQLKESLNLSNLQLRQSIELNVLQVVSLYYEVAKLTANVEVLGETADVSHSRLERVRYQFDYGQSTGVDVLNAEVDIQRDSINLITAMQQLSNNVRNLNVLMGIDIGTPIEVDTTVSYTDLSLNEFVIRAQLDNIDLLLAQKNYDVTAYDLELIEAERKPTLNANGAYNFSFSDNAPGSFVTFSNSRGFNAGVTAAWSIYDGGLRRLREQNTSIALQTQLIQKDEIEQLVLRDLTNSWETYQTALFILQSEAISLETSRLNFDRTQELFKVGQVSSVEFRQAQLNLLNAATNYNNAKFDAKIIELGLLQISGLLLAD